MRVITARNVGEAYAIALLHVHEMACPVEDSRSGPVRRLPYPLGTALARPLERVLYDPVRDANPFFHLMEALWMLAGSANVDWVAQFNRRMHDYSDNGVTLWGAYGHRWRRWFGRDQVSEALTALRQDPTSRRVVLSMWDPMADPVRAAEEGRDVPCNVVATLQLTPFTPGAPARRKLEMVVFARSHDLLWGLYGANAVHFAYLLEYLADALGVAPGSLTFMSANAHVYEAEWAKRYGGAVAGYPDSYLDGPYEFGIVRPYRPLIHPVYGTVEDFDRDLRDFVGPEWQRTLYAHPFMPEVAVPVREAWALRNTDPQAAMNRLADCAATDWRLGCGQWLERHRQVAVPAAWHTTLALARVPPGEDAS